MVCNHSMIPERASSGGEPPETENLEAALLYAQRR